MGKSTALKRKRSRASAKATPVRAKPYQPKMSKANARSAVKTSIGERIKLAEYRGMVAPLVPEERELLIKQAILMLEHVYAHLPLKRSLHANDPIQSLRLL